MRISYRSIKAILLAGALCMAAASCSGEKPMQEIKGGLALPSGQSYMVMEKILSDLPGRPRTTMKIIIPRGSVNDADALKAALEDTRSQDKTLKAVIIWAYRSRGELNGSNFTVGKLEWSDNGKDFNDVVALNPNPKINAMPVPGPVNLK